MCVGCNSSCSWDQQVYNFMDYSKQSNRVSIGCIRVQTNFKIAVEMEILREMNAIHDTNSLPVIITLYLETNVLIVIAVTSPFHSIHTNWMISKIIQNFNSEFSIILYKRDIVFSKVMFRATCVLNVVPPQINIHLADYPVP